jgi:hypothetical protein
MRRLGVLSLGMLMTVGLVLTGASGVAGAHPRAKSTAPTVNSISSAHGPIGGGTAVTIRGANIVSVTAVDFGTTPATGVIVKSQHAIVATSPPGSGTVDVRVKTPVGVSAIVPADQFSYVSTPTIQDLSPHSGATTGGTQVTISGSNLTGVTVVDFGSAPAASFTVNSGIAITAVAPAEAVGKVDVTVMSPSATSPIDPADVFTFALRVPVVTSVTPNSGPSGGGTQVVITGSQFLKKGTSVNFGPNPASGVTVLNSKTIMATSPAGSGVVDVTVTDSKGTSASGSSDHFTYGL